VNVNVGVDVNGFSVYDHIHDDETQPSRSATDKE